MTEPSKELFKALEALGKIPVGRMVEMTESDTEKKLKEAEELIAVLAQEIELDGEYTPRGSYLLARKLFTIVLSHLPALAKDNGYLKLAENPTPPLNPFVSRHMMDARYTDGFLHEGYEKPNKICSKQAGGK